MYVVQARVNGSIVDEEYCATLGEAWDAIDRRRRVLVNAGAVIVAEEARQFVVARALDGWITVTFAVGEPH